MKDKRDRIRWSPRIQPVLIKRLYERDALGIQDDDLCNDVGYRLYLRCRTIVMVSKDVVDCPRCGVDFEINTASKETISHCPTKGCGWQTTMLEYRQSWSKKRIWGASAIPTFEDYFNRYTPRLTYKEKIFLIDRLIHSFHWSLKEDLPGRSAANNLIEGNHDQVVAFLDQLTGMDGDQKAKWRETMERMMQRRKGQ